MMMSQTMRNRMNMVATVNIAGYISPRLREVSLTPSSLSHQLVESTRSKRHLTTQLKPFSITRITGSTWTHPEKLTRSISSLRMIPRANGSTS